MEDAVRQLLAVKGVRLTEPSQLSNIPGFILLGVAERVPEFGEIKGSPVTVWHIPSDLLPVSRAEMERWSVDASPGRHWLLSQRELPSDSESIFPSNSQVVAWGPEKMSIWFGEAILSGDLDVSLPRDEGDAVYSDSTFSSADKDEITLINSVINLESWLVQKNLDNALTYPVLLEGRLWEVKGDLYSPEGNMERDTWIVMEDPWSSNLSLFEDKGNGNETPHLRIIKPPESRWKREEELISKLPGILDTRRQGESEQSEDSVRSIMLEWWRVDVKSVTIRPMGAAFPAWVLNVEGRDDVLLHSINGRTYPLP
ncbi:MAG: hypothetical protein DBX04_02940 [Candidatus Poseidoniales archaeon]|nr:MAG: hypothetical protein DBX04_08385 [Candidatus Poseidoniales archaeon]RCH75503.1 MAG: hypothetical protein DBX04_06120 [Candidatus Poseidoniales archaeon]RCH76885.1 MAG: hypothetical protein DBX04_02940 [Candidatus Poseidoniales archaeon]